MRQVGALGSRLRCSSRWWGPYDSWEKLSLWIGDLCGSDRKYWKESGSKVLQMPSSTGKGIMLYFQLFFIFFFGIFIYLFGQENGGCGFFEWCENVSGANNSMGGSDSSSYPGLQCPCGAGLCMILTAKTGNNIGQQFYRCPANQVMCFCILSKVPNFVYCIFHCLLSLVYFFWS